MAATNYTPISLYYSTTAAAAPSSGNLVNGELAINITDGKLFYKDNGGTVKVLAGTGGTGVVAGSNTQVQFNNSGVFGASANFTWDGTSLTASNYVSTGNITINTNKFTVAGATGNTLIAGTATVGSLTSGRVTFAGTAGLLSDSANLTWNGSTFAITGNLTATTDSTFSSTGALTISKGTTGQQPGSPVTGMMRYNTSTNQFEGYSGASPAWKSIGGSALSNDTTTATDEYPVFASATTGTAENLYTSNAQYLFKPSTGELKVKAPVASNGIVVNADSVSSDYTIATGTNGFSVGPLTVNSGVTLTVASGQRHVVI